jgi:hypothetical protein
VLNVDYAFPWEASHLAPSVPLAKTRVRSYALDEKFVDLKMVLDCRAWEGFVLHPLNKDDKDFKGLFFFFGSENIHSLKLFHPFKQKLFYR